MIPPRAERARAIAVACTGSFVAAMSASMVAVAAPTVARAMSATPAQTSWILSAFMLVVSSVLATVGRLSDVIGRRPVFLSGSAIVVVASLACASAPSLGLLVAARVVQAVGAASLMATGPAIITRAFPPEQRARALGLQLAATYGGLTLGPTAGGLLTSAFGFRSVFVGIAAAASVTTLCAATLLPRDPPPREAPPLDVVGGALLAAALSSLLLALSHGTALERGGCVVVSLLAILALVRHGLRHPSPVLPLSLLETPAFSLGLLGAALLYAVTFVLAFLLPFHLQEVRGVDARRAGLLMTAQPAMMALSAPVSGWIADRVGPRIPAIAGMLAAAAGLLLVSRAAWESETSLVLALAVMGLGAGLFVAPNNAVIMSAAPRDRQGTAAAMAATARNVGMASGVALAVALRESIGFTYALVVAAGIACAGAALSVFRPVRSA